MYLKKLELQGFKSFPEKTRLEFDKGITAVVGPNGSGKSNISDAIRWVLGEQSAKSLRGGKMEDVIFAGTQNRKQVSFAEVSIVIDNSDHKISIDYEEITVTRRMYRSGEGEYLINAVPCRLKDIHALFMDTGIGREGYSIIGQGRIDEILSARAEDRRLLFEEAVGIVKFKNRKMEAEARLEKEKQNLIRVEDIITEISSQLPSLEEQAEVAKKYLNYSNYLKLIQVNIFIHEVEGSEEKAKMIQSDIDNLASDIKIIEENKGKIQSENEILKKESIELEERFIEMNNEFSDSRSKIEQFENDIKLYLERIKHIETDILRLNKEINKNEIEKQKNEKEKAFLQTKYDAINIELESKQNALSTREEEFKIFNDKMSGSQQRIDHINTKIFEKMTEISELKSEIQKISIYYEQMEIKKEEIDNERNFTLSDINDKTVKESLILKRKNDLETQIYGLEQSVMNFEDAIIKQREEERLTSIKYNEVNKSLNEANTRLKVLRELEQSHEGYYNSVKAILNKKKQNINMFTGINGVVGELIIVEKHLEVAIEIALGQAIQNIVTETEEDAKIAIEFLKNNKQGRATFLPLTAIKPKKLGSVKNSLLEEKGVLGVAKELIKYESKYENIFSSLLDTTIVVDTIENAIVIHKKYNHLYKMVTLSGEILSAGGAMTGGYSSKNTGNIFGRNREIIEITQRINTLKEEESTLSISLNMISEKLQHNEEINYNNKELLQTKNIEKATINQEYQQITNVLAELKQKEISLAQEDKNIMIEIVESNKKIRIENERLEQKEREKEELQNEIGSFQNTIIVDTELREGKINEITDIKVLISGLTQNMNAIIENINRIENDINSNNLEITNCYNEIDVCQKDKLKIETEIERFNETIITLKTEQIVLKTKSENLQKQRNETIESIETNQKEINSLVDMLNRHNNEYTRLCMKKEQAEEDIRKLYDTMWEDYEITYTSAKSYEKLDKSLQDLQHEERNTKNDIKNLGPINIMAIEEYKEKKERYDFLTGQKEDILLAEENLKELIKELIILMEEQFKTQMAIISKNFNEVFHEMFGGGNAHLVISSEENILDAGIEIKAQPPGKNLQILSLLSGGERALTAMALLFAILRMKPSPFCILDEIEAALDDANVNRYANFLKNFSMDTQFILITHKKGTMNSADVLYGVTMQEQGISKLVSVKFSDDEYTV